MIKTYGVHHIVIGVSNLEKSKIFYVDVCGMNPVIESKEAVGLTDGVFSLWIYQANKEKKFDNMNIGLGHWAFNVDSMDELKEIENHLNLLNIEMEDGGITDDDYGGKGIFTKDPDGMKIEFHLK